MEQQGGFIYVLTNPSFPDYVKIGYADDVDSRVQQLNNSESIPFAFRVYATYEVSSRLRDKNLHEIIDLLNPELRSRDNLNGRERVREFYQMSAEKVCAILKAMSIIHDCEDKLVIRQMTSEENSEADTAERTRAQHFTFKLCEIEPCEEIEFCNPSDPTDAKNGTKFTVIDDRHVEYNGESWSLSKLASEFTGIKSVAGPRYFKYNGEWLNDIRSRIGF